MNGQWFRAAGAEKHCAPAARIGRGVLRTGGAYCLSLAVSSGCWAEIHDEPGNAPPGVSWSLELSDQETFLASRLTAAERVQIIDQVEQTSFDVPDNWQSELRVRRVSLGGAPGLVVRGMSLLCGGTGNCQTWVFRLSHGTWFNLFEQEAPILSAFGFQEGTNFGIKNLIVSSNSSAQKEHRILFKFDGKYYRQSDCYDVSINAPAAEKVVKVSCK